MPWLVWIGVGAAVGLVAAVIFRRPEDEEPAPRLPPPIPFPSRDPAPSTPAISPSPAAPSSARAPSRGVQRGPGVNPTVPGQTWGERFPTGIPAAASAPRKVDPLTAGINFRPAAEEVYEDALTEGIDFASAVGEISEEGGVSDRDLYEESEQEDLPDDVLTITPAGWESLLR